MKTYEELMGELTDTQARLEAERKDMAARFQKEQEKMVMLAQAERRSQQEAYQAKVDEHERKKRVEEAAVEARKQQDTAARMATEQAAHKADEEYRLYHEKLQEVKKAIAEAELSEEKHRKALEDVRNNKIQVEDFPIGDAISVGHPTAPDNKGEAVIGTEGNTPDTPMMSFHLKQILRQAQR